MNDQHFNDRVEYVAGRDVHVHSPGERMALGPLKWVAKDYWFGRRITAGWLAIALFSATFVSLFAQLVINTRRLFVHPPQQMPQPTGTLAFMAPLVGSALLMGIAVLAAQVHRHGLCCIPGTLTAFARDANRHIFRGRLGGEGVTCPKCNAQLRFQQVGSYTALKCTFNSAHAWLFDFTTVHD